MVPAEARSGATTEISDRVRLVRGEIELDGPRILRVDLDDEAPLDPACVICPGFIDAHLHLPQFDSIGADGLTLLDWLGSVIFPAEARWSDAGYAEAMSQRVAQTLLARGTTGVCAYATVHHASTQHAMQALSVAGLSGYVGQVLMDRNAPAELVRPASQLLNEAASLNSFGIDNSDPAHGHIQPIVSPRFAITCSMDLMKGAAALAEERNWRMQTHLAEMVPECTRVREMFDGLGYVDVYDRAGMVTDRSIFAHAIWLSEAEHALLAHRGATIAHCPTANVFLRSGAMDIRSLLPGTRLTLGSDVAGGPDICMVRVARAMLENAKRMRSPFIPGAPDEAAAVPSAAECWWQITAGNARMLGLTEVGSLRPAMRADLAILSPTETDSADNWSTSRDPLASLLYQFNERWITRTIAGGRVVHRA